MLYSFQHSFLFTHIARTGGISIGKTLDLAGVKIRPLGEQHGPLFEARRHLGETFEATFKASMVRNPWDRLVSWHSFIVGVQAGGRISANEIADPDARHWAFFDAFVESVLEETVIIDGRSCPAFSQTHQLSDAQGNLLPDFIGRFETFTESTTDMFARAGIRVPTIAHENASAHKPYAMYYSETAKDLVETKLALDIKTFNYDFELS